MSYECNNCKKYIVHGGNCQGTGRQTLVSPCLMFKKDKRGYVTNKNVKMELGFGCLIPPFRTFDNDWEYEGNPIKFYHIEPLRWDMKRCVLVCKANVDIFEQKQNEEKQEEIITKIMKFGE